MKQLALALAAASALMACGDPEINQPPIAVAGADLRVELIDDLAEVRLDGAESFDPDDDLIEWRWTVVRAPSGLQIFGESRTAAEPMLNLRAPGLYIFELIVTDGITPSAPDYVNVVVAQPATGG